LEISILQSEVEQKGFAVKADEAASNKRACFPTTAIKPGQQGFLMKPARQFLVRQLMVFTSP